MTRDDLAKYCLRHCEALASEGREDEMVEVLVATCGAEVVAPYNLPWLMLNELYWALMEARHGEAARARRRAAHCKKNLEVWYGCSGL